MGLAVVARIYPYDHARAPSHRERSSCTQRRTPRHRRRRNLWHPYSARGGEWDIQQRVRISILVSRFDQGAAPCFFRSPFLVPDSSHSKGKIAPGRYELTVGVTDATLPIREGEALPRWGARARHQRNAQECRKPLTTADLRPTPPLDGLQPSVPETVGGRTLTCRQAVTALSFCSAPNGRSYHP
jgi:hypothetical protein